MGLALALLVPAAAAAAPPEAEPLTLRFAPEKDYGPFVFVDAEGRLRGLSVELLQLVQRNAGLHVSTLPAAPLAEQLSALREGRAELLSSLRPTPERAAFLAFSTPYVSVPAILVRREAAGARTADAPSAAQALAGLGGRPVAVGRAYAAEGFVRQRFPQVDWVPVPDDVAALRGVVDGRFDAAVVDAASASFVQRHQGLAGLRSAGPIGFDYRLSFAVPLHRTDLLARVDAGIRAISTAERAAVVERWMAPLERSPDAPSAWRTPAARWGLGLIAVSAVLAVGLAAHATGRPRARAPGGDGA